jgi:glycosyltransferase involved in cell wall biosynthesis
MQLAPRLREISARAIRLFRRLAWERLPTALRRAALRRLSTALAPRLARDMPPCEPIYVAGLLSSRVGMGEGARLCLEALDALGYDARGFDLSPLFGRGDMPGAARYDEPVAPGAGTVIIHLNPDQLPLSLTMIGRRRLAGKRIVGFWSWELARIPESWHIGLELVDEIWTPSRFVADAIRPLTKKPVYVAPHPVAIGAAGRKRRAAFGIPDEVFAVATIFDMASCFARKYPLAAIRAFRNAFGANGQALLIVKVSGASSEPALMEELREAAGGASNIRIVEENLTRADMLDLIASVDVLLSPHRSEGFGLTLAQAMLARTAVIATGWSGNLDFMNETAVKLLSFDMVPVADPQGCYAEDGQVWAEPDVAEATAALTELAADRSRLAQLGSAGHEEASRALGLEAYRAAVAPALHPGMSASSGLAASAVH